MKIIDADGHVAEGAALGQRAMERWPQHVKISFSGRPSLLIEGRVTRPADLDSAIERALATLAGGRSALLDVFVEP